MRRGPLVHKPFILTINVKDIIQEWLLIFRMGPKFSSFKAYEMFIKTITDTCEVRYSLIRFCKHEVYYKDYQHIFGFYCSDITEANIPLFLEEWRRVWLVEGFDGFWYRTK